MPWLIDWLFRRHEVVSTSSKIEARKHSIPRQDSSKARIATSSQKSIQRPRFGTATTSKVDSRPSSKAKPNNPKTKEVFDRVTKTLDNQE